MQMNKLFRNLPALCLGMGTAGERAREHQGRRHDP